MNTIEQLYNEWLSLQPLTADNQKRLNDKFMLEFNYNSNHIEGNTLSYGQTKLLLLFGKIESEEGTPFRDFEEMKAHAAGLRWIKELAADKEHRITEHDIKQLNHIILAEDFYKAAPNGNRYKVHVGQYKTRPNSVITATGEEFAYASPEETPAMMYELVNWLSEEIEKSELSPVELATLLHYRYIRIHPFEDGNGRVARLLVTYVLECYGYPMLIIKSKDKEQYLNALNLADVNVGLSPSDGAMATLEQVTPFVNYMTRQAEWSLAIAIAAAKGDSIDEDEDWKKKLSIKLGDKKGAPERTDEIIVKIEKEVFKPLLEKVYKEISPFFPLFFGVKYEELHHDAKWGKYLVFAYKFFKDKNDSTTLLLELDIKQYEYEVSISINNFPSIQSILALNKRYDTELNEDEIKAVVNKMGELILEYYDNQ